MGCSRSSMEAQGGPLSGLAEYSVKKPVSENCDVAFPRGHSLWAKDWMPFLFTRILGLKEG